MAYSRPKGGGVRGSEYYDEDLSVSAEKPAPVVVPLPVAASAATSRPVSKRGAGHRIFDQKMHELDRLREQLEALPSVDLSQAKKAFDAVSKTPASLLSETEFESRKSTRKGLNREIDEAAVAFAQASTLVSQMKNLMTEMRMGVIEKEGADLKIIIDPEFQEKLQALELQKQSAEMRAMQFDRAVLAYKIDVLHADLAEAKSNFERLRKQLGVELALPVPERSAELDDALVALARLDQKKMESRSEAGQVLFGLQREMAQMRVRFERMGDELEGQQRGVEELEAKQKQFTKEAEGVSEFSAMNMRGLLDQLKATENPTVQEALRAAIKNYKPPHGGVLKCVPLPFQEKHEKDTVVSVQFDASEHKL